MKRFFCTIYFLNFLIITAPLLTAQNIGVNTNIPTAKLHIQGGDIYKEPVDEDYEINSIPSQNNTGDVDWYITAMDGYLSPKSAKLPIILKADHEAVLEYNFSQAAGKTVTISLVYKYSDNNNSISFGLSTNEGDYFPPLTGGSWKSFTASFVSTGTNNTFKIRALANISEANPELLIDNVLITYTDGQPLKITDGYESDGFILESDALGHTKWVDLRSETDLSIDSKIAAAHQDLHFNSSSSELSITDGNAVKIAGLKNSSGYAFKLDGYTLKGDPGLSIDIPNVNSITSKFYYNSIKGQFIRGRYSTNFIAGDFATSWGRNTMAAGDYATSFGVANSASGLRSTSWGVYNLSSNTNSTSWGNLNKAQGLNATTWGAENTANGINVTAFGQKNNIIGDNATVSGSNNTVSGNLNMVWGENNTTNNSHTSIWGKNNISNGSGNTIAGADNVASGSNSFIFGSNCITTRIGEVALGEYNLSTPNTLFSLGTGSSTVRNNALTILNNGYIGIGTNSPYYGLHIAPSYYHSEMKLEAFNGFDSAIYLEGEDSRISINSDDESRLSLIADDKSIITLDGDNESIIRFKGSTNSSHAITYDQSTNAMSILRDIYIDNGNVGINEDAPSYDLHLRSNDAAKPGSSSWTVSSDSRLKKEVRPFQDGLNIISAINPVWFTYNGKAGMEEGTYVGTIAQELEALAPYMVGSFDYEEENGHSTTYKDVDYGAMDFVLINAIKEQQALIHFQSSEIETLKSLLNDQQKQINAILTQQQK